MSDEKRLDRCSGCGLVVEGGDEGCNARFQQLTGRSFGDVRFGRLHSMVVDTYCLQHPDRYCLSAKSLAAHLCGLCWTMERGGDTGMPNMALRHWLDGTVSLVKPKLPAERGEFTIGDVDGPDDPAAFEKAVIIWAGAVWAAYEPLHTTARQWLDEAMASGPSGQRHGLR